MKNVLNFITDNWILITPIILEVGARLLPTEKNYSILSHAVKILNVVIPNLKKNKDSKGITTHLIILFVLFGALNTDAQVITTTKAIMSTNASDTTLIKNTRANLAATNGNTGGLYFDKVRNKWRIWVGTCAACPVDSAWVDLPMFSGTGTVTNVSGTSPIAVATGTTTPVISMPAAASAQAGYVNTAAQTFGGVKTLGSPVFTGIPVAPTAAPGTNTTQLATTAFVTAAIPATVTASNGLTKTVNNIALGGTQSTDITLAGASHNITFDAQSTFSITGGSTIFTTDDGFDPIDQINLHAGTAVAISGPTTINSGSNSLNMSGATNTFGGVVLVTPTGARAGLNLGNNTVTTTTSGDLWFDSGTSPAGISYYNGSATVSPIDGTMSSTKIPYGVDGNSVKTDGTGTFTYTEGASGYTTVNHIRMGVPPWYGSVTYGIVSDNPAFGVNISSADGTVGTPTPFQVTMYGGKAYTVGNNLGGDVTIGSGTGNGTSRSGNVIIDLGSSRGSLFGYLKILNIPTSSAGLPSGAVYSNAGILTIVP